MGIAWKTYHKGVPWIGGLWNHNWTYQNIYYLVSMIYQFHPFSIYHISMFVEIYHANCLPTFKFLFPWCLISGCNLRQTNRRILPLHDVPMFLFLSSATFLRSYVPLAVLCSYASSCLVESWKENNKKRISVHKRSFLQQKRISTQADIDCIHVDHHCLFFIYLS